MNLARSVADVVAEHVSFEVECIDRMYCNLYVPRLQYAGGLVGFVHRQLGLPIASTAPLAAITDRFVKDVHAFAQANHIPWVDFAKGQRKDDVMAERLAGFSGSEGVVFIGRAQEKTNLFRTEKRRNGDGRSYPWIVRSTGLVNHFYFYCLDADFGPFFLKFCSYFPYTAKLCLNGHHWAQRQAAKRGIGFTAMDNAFGSVEDVAGLQTICDTFGPAQIYALVDKWLPILPDPFTDDDRAAGYRYDVSILQAEFSLTQMLDAPVTGRIFFEHVIRDNLDIGRADQVGLIFNRKIQHRTHRPTPGRFRTRVITAGVTPSLHADYKHTTVKQYHKEGRALRTETTINDTRDFRIGKGLGNLPALREIGFSANRRLLGRPTTRPRPDRRNPHPARCPRPGHHQDRHPHPRPTARPATQPRAALGAADLPHPAPRVHQPRPTTTHRRTPRARPQPSHREPDHLRPPETEIPRPHRTRPPQPPLPRHRPRSSHRNADHPRP